MDTAEQARWLLHMPSTLVDRLQPEELVAELVRRLRELLGRPRSASRSTRATGPGSWPATATARSRAERPVVEVRLPMTSPLRGTLRVEHGPGRRRWRPTRSAPGTSPS